MTEYLPVNKICHNLSFILLMAVKSSTTTPYQFYAHPVMCNVFPREVISIDCADADADCVPPLRSRTADGADEPGAAAAAGAALLVCALLPAAGRHGTPLPLLLGGAGAARAVRAAVGALAEEAAAGGDRLLSADARRRDGAGRIGECPPHTAAVSR